MKRLLLVMTLSLSLALAAQCAQVTVTLRPRAAVKATQMVKLGEMATLTGVREEAEQLRNVEIARAPLPGAARQVTPDWIKTRLACAGFDLKTITIKAPASVMLVSESQTAKSVDIIDAAKRFILGQLSQSDFNYTITTNETTADSVIPSGKLELVAEQSDRPITPGRQQVCIDLMVDGAVYTKKSMSLNIKAIGPVLVATEAIKAREALTTSNTKIEQREITTATCQLLSSIPDGRIANRPISSGAVVTSEMVIARPAVSKGEAVTVTVRSGAVKIVVKGTASEDGATGDNIRISIPGGREEVQATVTEAGAVEVKA